MDGILKIYVSVSVSATLLAAALLLLRPLYKRKFSMRWQYYIWLLVVLRLIIPWNPVGGVVGFIFQDRQAQAGGADMAAIRAKEAGTAEGEGDGGGQKDLQETESPLGMGAAKGRKIWAAWLSVAFFIFMRKITVYQSFIKFMKASSIPVDDIRLLETLGKEVNSSRLRHTVGLYLNHAVSSPQLTGFFRPKIILTPAQLECKDFYYTVLHELVHDRRHDMVYKWLIQFVVCLHWFNPFVYFMEREISRMCELSCDEAVIEKLDAAGRQEYGDTLLHAVGAGGFYRHNLAGITFYNSKQLLKERFGAIMDYRKKTKKMAAISAAAALLLAAGGIVTGAYIQPVAAEEADKGKQREEYGLLGITQKKGSFYYKGKRVRIFMDVRADGSFAEFSYDRKGSVDVKLTRAGDFSVKHVGNVPKTEADEILQDMELDGLGQEEQQQAGKKKNGEGKQEISVSRIDKTDLPGEVSRAVLRCKAKKWYVIRNKGLLYICYKGLPNGYAFQPNIHEGKAEVEIVDFGKSGKQDLLLVVEENVPLTVFYQNKAVKYKVISV